VLRGAARPDRRAAADRGRAAADLPHPPAGLGGASGAAARLRHTYGTELASAGIDLLALRELMGHANPETTAAYVHLSPETLAAEYARARAAGR